MTLVDTDILLDLATAEPGWAEWSTHALQAASRRAELFINDGIYAEFSVRYDHIEKAAAFVSTAGLQLIRIPREAPFLAGKVFASHRRAGGTRTGVLPDFFIGAHAQVAGFPLLTRDPRRARTDFPSVELVAPDA